MRQFRGEIRINFIVEAENQKVADNLASELFSTIHQEADDLEVHCSNTCLEPLIPVGGFVVGDFVTRNDSNHVWEIEAMEGTKIKFKGEKKWVENRLFRLAVNEEISAAKYQRANREA